MFRKRQTFSQESAGNMDSASSSRTEKREKMRTRCDVKDLSNGRLCLCLPSECKTMDSTSSLFSGQVDGHLRSKACRPGGSSGKERSCAVNLSAHAAGSCTGGHGGWERVNWITGDERRLSNVKGENHKREDLMRGMATNDPRTYSTE